MFARCIWFLFCHKDCHIRLKVNTTSKSHYGAKTQLVTDWENTSDQHRESSVHWTPHIHCQPLNWTQSTLAMTCWLPAMAVMGPRWPHSITPLSGEHLGNDSDSGYPELVLNNLNKAIGNRGFFNLQLSNNPANVVIKNPEHNQEIFDCHACQVV